MDLEGDDEIQIDSDEIQNDSDGIEVEQQDTSNASGGDKRRRKTKSKIWEKFYKVQPEKSKDGKGRGICKRCKKVYLALGSYGTNNLRRHKKICVTPQAGQTSIQSEGPLASLSTNFDPEKFRELLVAAIVMHELPFQFVEYQGIRAVFSYIAPNVKLISRNTVKSDVMNMFRREKERLKNQLKLIPGRISLTSDMWSSFNWDGYICLTAHFVDDDWKLQKRILALRAFPSRHRGIDICEKVASFLSEWGIDRRLFAVTLDNATNNDVFVSRLKSQLNVVDALICEGDLFHVRCAAHVLNLIVQDGLKAIDKSVTKIRESVKYVKGSQARRKAFFECVKQVNLDAKKGLNQDVTIRWNSTYLMLRSALYFRNAFNDLQWIDSSYTYCPTGEEWDKVEKICNFLKMFYDCTCIFSGTQYPTSNLYFPRVFSIQNALAQGLSSADPFIKDMAGKMYPKFEKYWSEHSCLLAIACVMDPRYKLRFIEFSYKILYGGTVEFDKLYAKLFELYDHYSTSSNVMFSSSSTMGADDVRRDTSADGYHANAFFDVMKEFAIHESQETSLRSKKSELEQYLEEPLADLYTELDVLCYWKTNKGRYPHLSVMARDVLSVPVTTVASECAFSASGRVLDRYRSALKPETVEALVCTRDWLYGLADNLEPTLDDLTADVLKMRINTTEIEVPEGG